MPLNLNLPQNEFYKLNKPFRAFVGGYRSGKTFLGCVRLCALALEYPSIKLGYFAPTYPQIRDIFYTTIEEVGELFGIEVDIKQSTHEVTLKYYGDVHAVIKCRSMEHPSRIVGFDINHALVDEIDCMKKEKADQAWKKIIARLSSEGFDEQRLFDEEVSAELIIEALDDNTVDFTTTPEGFNWIYDLFVKGLRKKPELKKFYGIVHASTRQNRKNLQVGYIEKLYATYPSNLVDAYIDGQFVNLQSGTVYLQFDRKENHTDRVWDGKEALHIGMDFNVGRMAAVTHVIDDGLPRAVDELTDGVDTPDMIRMVKNRYWIDIGGGEYQKTCEIYVYPDSSGKNRKSVGASQTDISLLNDAGFRCMFKPTNPAVKDRVNAMNAMFKTTTGERRYLVNTNKCPHYTEKLEQQVYKNGEPDKDGTEDVNDAGGYFIAYKYPIKKPVVSIPVTFAL